MDDHAVDYLLGALEDLPARAEIKVVVTVDEPLPADLGEPQVAEAMAAHFAYEEVRLGRELRKHVKKGQRTLVVGVSVLVVFLSLAELVARQIHAHGYASEHVLPVLREGLVIAGWVAMWRPVEALLYDWWPLWTERAAKRRLREAPVAVRVSRGSAAEAGAGLLGA